MISKRLFGHFFLLLAVALTFAIAVPLHSIYRVLLLSLKLITGNLDSSLTGDAWELIIYWVAHIIATLQLFNYGVRWSRKEVTT